MNKFKGKKRKPIEDNKSDDNLMSEESQIDAKEVFDSHFNDNENSGQEEYIDESDGNEDMNNECNDSNDYIEDNDIQNGDNLSEEPIVKKSKLLKNKKKKSKTPTAQELNNLRETEALFHSSLFRLQVSYNRLLIINI
jgi:hypothetical protein